MAFRRIHNELITQDGKVYNDGTGQFKWYHSNTEEAITVGEYIIYRMPITVPKGGYVESAIFSVEYTVKFGGTVPQSFGYEAYLEIDADPYPSTNDVYLSVAGEFPLPPRRRTRSQVTGTLNYLQETAEADWFNVDLAVQMNEIISRPDYQPGEHTTVIIKPTSENGDLKLRTRDSSVNQPHMIVKYRVDYMSDRRDEINWLQDTTAETDHAAVNENVVYFGEFFGYHAPGGTVVRSTERPRTGAYSWKVTGGPTDGTKKFGVGAASAASPNTSYIFCGWVYIPSSNPHGVLPHFPYDGSPGQIITVKDQWVPFSTASYSLGGIPIHLHGAVSSTGPSNPAYTFYVDDLAIIESKFPQTPFTGHTADKNLIEHKFTGDGVRDLSVRVSRARTQAHAVPATPYMGWNAVSKFTNPSGGGTFTMNGSAVRTTVAANLSGMVTSYLTHTMIRNKKYLGVRSVGSADYYLNRIIREGEPDIVRPIIEKSEGDWDYYDLGDRETNIIIGLEWAAYSNISPTYFDIYELVNVESLRLGMGPRQKYALRDDGLWVLADSERQSPSWDDYEIANLSWDEFKATGKTWDGMEADTSI